MLIPRRLLALGGAVESVPAPCARFCGGGAVLLSASGLPLSSVIISAVIISASELRFLRIREDKSFSRLRQKAGNNHFFLVANEVSLRSRSMQRWHLVAGQDGKHGSGGDATVILLVDSAFSTLLEVIFSIAILFAAVISGSTPNSSSQSSGENRSARFCGLISSFARLLELRKLIPGR